MSVVTFAGDQVPDASSRVFYVALVPRDQMNVGMVNRLASVFAAIDTDVESNCSMEFFENHSNGSNQQETSSIFFV